MEQHLPAWPGTGFYPVAAVGTKFHLEALRRLAQNPPGTHAFLLCAAELVPEPDNPHDSKAVAIRIDGFNVAHLAREAAPGVPSALSRAGLPADAVTLAKAVVSGGLSTPDRDYAYTIDLDIDLRRPNLVFGERLAVPSTHRLPRYPQLESQPDGSLTARVWLPVSSHDLLHKKRGVMLWTTDEWDTVNFYADNFKRAGLGHKILEMPKCLFNKMFGDDRLEMSVEDLQGRWATLRVRPSNSQHHCSAGVGGAGIHQI